MAVSTRGSSARTPRQPAAAAAAAAASKRDEQPPAAAAAQTFAPPPPPAGPAAWLPASWTLALMTALLAATSYVAAHAPAPYMDEPFHVPMAARYCRGDLLYWDPKITTFPGVYVLGAAYAWLASAALRWATGGRAALAVTCAAPFLRSLNALLAVAVAQLAHALSVELQRAGAAAAASSSSSAAAAGRSSSTRGKSAAAAAAATTEAAAARATALQLALLPTHAFFALLFYTDVPALLFLLATELALLRGRRGLAAAAGAAAVAMRQTNAVWVAFLTGADMLRALLLLRQQQQQQRKKGRAGGGAAAGSQLSAAAAELGQLLAAAWDARAPLLAAYAPLLLLPALFVGFLACNGGAVTLGDKDAHAPCAHPAQLAHFAGFALLAAAPQLLLGGGNAGGAGSSGHLSPPQRLAAAARRAPLLAAVVAAGAVAAAGVAATRGALAHPYLLADNRHYTFYLWRRLLGRGAAVRWLALAPAYAAGWLLLLAGLSAAQHWLWVAAFVASAAVTLVPAWLLELRYFTAPLALALLHLPPPPRLAPVWALAAAFAAVNAVTVYVFAQRPFTWADGSVARFMW